MRLFAGLALSGEAAARLASLRLRLATPVDGLRWSSPEQWHITLKFFGEVDSGRALELAAALAGIKGEPVELRMEELGLFAAKGILYASIAPSARLHALHAQVALCSARCGVLPESRPFRPHVTLARSRNRTGLISLKGLSRPALPALGPAVRWTEEEALLYEGVILPAGAEYRVISRVSLQAPRNGV